MLFYIIYDNFYKNIEQIKKQIKECHDDYKKRKDNLNKVRDGIIGCNTWRALQEDVVGTGKTSTTIN